MGKFIFNEIFEDEPHEFAKIKGSQRIQINSILSAMAVGVIAIMISNGTAQKISDWIIIQLSAPIPLLITSSLFFSKTSYRHKREYPYWNVAAGITHSLGYFSIINAVVLVLFFGGYETAAWVMLVMVLVLIFLYSLIDYLLNKKRIAEKLVKLLIYFAIIFVGTAPMLKSIF